MNVLFVASECAPFIKTGGLADVIGAVPKALAKLGVHVRVLFPGYPAVAKLIEEGTVLQHLDALHGGSARIVYTQAEGLELLFLDAPHLFDRPGNPYLNEDGFDWPDNHRRFGGLSYVASQITIHGVKDWKPDVVHAHDWQAGLVSAYLKQANQPTPPSMITIHNIAFQGLFPESTMTELGLPDAMFHVDGLEYFKQLSFLKSGLVFSDKITTVSPTYANELMSPEFGMGLEGIIASRRDDVSGILNGIDVDVWDPSTDKHLHTNYNADSIELKARNKQELESRFGLDSNAHAPLFCVISRLTSQKGLDVLLNALPSIVSKGARLALLGTGDRDLEDAFRNMSRTYKGLLGVVIGYDEALSKLMFGGADAIIIPSRFEPCGLTQLYGLRYGTLPVVARTGGLADTVIDANNAALAAECATGFEFSPVTVESLSETLNRVCELYADSARWNTMVDRAMHHPVGWEASATSYLEHYQKLLARY